MSEEVNKEILSAREWMDYYEKLFRENNPVKSSPLSVKGEKEDGHSEEMRRDN